MGFEEHVHDGVFGETRVFWRNKNGVGMAFCFFCQDRRGKDPIACPGHVREGKEPRELSPSDGRTWNCKQTNLPLPKQWHFRGIVCSLGAWLS
jgi:hypothetical protein